MRANLQELDLAPGTLPLRHAQEVDLLTSFISEATGGEAGPESADLCLLRGAARALHEAHQGPGGQNPAARAPSKSYQEGLARCPDEAQAGTEIRFSELPTQMFPAGATSR